MFVEIGNELINVNRIDRIYEKKFQDPAGVELRAVYQDEYGEVRGGRVIESPACYVPAAPGWYAAHCEEDYEKRAPVVAWAIRRDGIAGVETAEAIAATPERDGGVLVAPDGRVYDGRTWHESLTALSEAEAAERDAE